MEDFDATLPAIWLVFGGSYLNHQNAPTDNGPEECDHREQLLIDLLSSFLEGVLVSSGRKLSDYSPTQRQLNTVLRLLKLWSQDLTLIYQIRKGKYSERQMACRFLERVKHFESCTIIPNGLISAGHTCMGSQYFESVCLGILLKRNGLINWTQVDPGGAYHQHCKHVAGEKCNAYLDITDIDPNNITEDWLYLLVGLKAVPCKSRYYKNVSLYECLLSHLNGKTVFRSEPDDEFVTFSNESPTHSWQVVNMSFRYFLQHLVDDSYQFIYEYLLTNFKLFLMEETLTAYQNRATKKIKQCHFLLQEMCRDVAQQAFDHGNNEQKQRSFQLIKKTKAAIEKYCSQQTESIRRNSQLNVPHVSSLSFVPPNVVNPSHSSSSVTRPDLHVHPVFLKREAGDNIIDYLQNLKLNFIDELKEAEDIEGTALLAYGIEMFLIDDLANTNILDQSADSPFSTNDARLANALKTLGEIYYGCQSRLVKNFLSNLTYQPQFFAKNITIQFFVYAAIAALNYRDRNIGPLLLKHNLSVTTFNQIIPHLVIDDSRWMNALLTVKVFFTSKKGAATLFSRWFSFNVENKALLTDADVRFAYLLLRKYPNDFKRFNDRYLRLEEENFNQKWADLTYTDSYLPSLYYTLSKVAYLAKVCLLVFPSTISRNYITVDWVTITRRIRSTWSPVYEKFGPPYYYESEVTFKFNAQDVTDHFRYNYDLLTTYVIKSSHQNGKDPYQRFVTCKEKEEKGYGPQTCMHFLENEVIATQDLKPGTMSCNQYKQLGFLQSEPRVKLERLYVALKDKQLDCCCEQEGVLIKQTLFEVSLLMENEGKICGLLEWTAKNNPDLVHAFGLLCIEKTLAMQYRLTQHNAIGDLLLVILGLLTFYPTDHKYTFMEGIMGIYSMLQNILAEPPAHLSDTALLHLNAYLLIAVRANPEVLQTDMMIILKALVNIQHFKVKGSSLNNIWLLHVYEATMKLCSWFENIIDQRPTLLNDLMLSVDPQWDSDSVWHRSPSGLLFTSNDHAMKPLLGSIYFQNQPIMGLPSTITSHQVFKEYLGDVKFIVMTGSCPIDGQATPCFLSVDRTPQLRLTLTGGTLLIEERIGSNFQCYCPAQKLLGHFSGYPRLLSESPYNGEKLRHWLCNDESILIKDKERQIIFKWDRSNNFLYSLHHKGYVVPWEKLQNSFFKIWLERIESSVWIQLIAKTDSLGVLIDSLHFPRLGLNFYFKDGKIFSKQVHGYVIAQQQHLNTLHGFSNYIVLESKEDISVRKHIKVIIPHWGVVSTGPFYVNTATVNHSGVRSPAYFVYDYDLRIGLLKGANIRSQLYLALIYFRTASLDDHDTSHCNPYHLTRENLEICWKDQPYDQIELDIIERLLHFSAMRCQHSHSVAIYLTVVSLLNRSLERAFLFTDESIERNKEKSKKLLETCRQHLPHLFLIYHQHKPSISARILPTTDEEKDAENNSSLYLPSNASKHYYNDHYRDFFPKENLVATTFVSTFESCLSTVFNSFVYDKKGVNFSGGFNEILLDRFRLIHFLTLYEFAKAGSVTVLKYRYLLHHMLIRAQVNYQTFPVGTVKMLGRVLLLVTENPDSFPNAPCWFNAALVLDLSDRTVCKTKLLRSFPSIAYKWQNKLTEKENIEARIKARKEDQDENETIWTYFSSNDLDRNGVPCCLPEDPDCFALKYEPYVSFSEIEKRKIVRKHYLQAAYNDAMYQFFISVLKRCDELKYTSAMGWAVAPFIGNAITVLLSANKESLSPTPEPLSFENWAIAEQTLIDINSFFLVHSQPAENSVFLFDSLLDEPENGYQRQFYSELKDSWSAYTNETQFNYSWLNSRSVHALETDLRTKFDEIHNEAEQLWDKITNLFKLRSNSQLNNYFALRWYGGQVRHYSKCDILRLLIEPHKLSSYNPDCLEKSDDIIQKLLQYVILEINSSKIVRGLTLVEQYRRAVEEHEKFSVLQTLVKCLQENLDPESYRYPHWLLFQFENEIIVRKNQRELIIAMLNQEENAMYQLNMGEGKSSVILPLLSCNLTNRKQLLRINILSALLSTMKEFLRQRFSGLIQKRVYTLPFNRDTDISTRSLKVIFETLQTCKNCQHILLVTPENRLCLQLKFKELMLEHQQQIGATDVFNWETYRQRAHCRREVYKDLHETEKEDLFKDQNSALRTCLRKDGYIDSSDRILKVPPRGQGRTEFARFKDTSNNIKFREWSCLKAAYRELLYNSSVAHQDCSGKLSLLNQISEVTAIDLLDESDEILRHGTELNYTVGDKYVFAGGELRWIVPQFFIRMIFCDPDLKDVITAGKARGFTSINLSYSSQGGVPFVQLLSKSYYEDEIKPLLVNKFFKENLPTLRKYQCSEDNSLIQGENSSLRQYINGQLSSGTEKKVLDVLCSRGSLKDKVLIAKGWLSHGILFHVFNAKYRVRYGLNLNPQGQAPKPIAIPFFGKDAPSPRSEFSHPDVMLGFTIISYLYQGLNRTQLKNTLNKLRSKFSLQVADALLSAWAKAGRPWIERQSGQFPPLILTSLQHLDLEDERCVDEVHLYLSGNYNAIIFYLNQFVLLEEAMQYLYKISANAHSLVGYDAALGFSGTDDRKITMPFQIKSLRSKTQEGTNGKLLSVLTQERNSKYHTVEADDTEDLLKQLCKYAGKTPHCHALIDAGALITGFTNHAVAEFLLGHLPSNLLGILYFSDEGNCLTVLTRDKKTIALQDCYLDKQYLFAYLDDIHTRGTDIKLPLNCRAILTIGMGMEKDKLMQAAMRLRQLAQKQSVYLWGTQAVTFAISRDNSVDKDKIDSREVIKWVGRNTINHINEDLFHVAVRKVNFQFMRRAEMWLKEAPTTLESLIQYCQDKELFRLEDFYALSPQREDLANRLYWFICSRFKQFWQELEQEMRSKNLIRTAFHEKIFKRSDRNTFRNILFTIYEDLQPYLMSDYVHDSLDNNQEKEVEVEIIQEQVVVHKIEKRKQRSENPWDARLILRKDFINVAKQHNIIMPLNGIKHFIQIPADLKNIFWWADIYMTSNYILSVVCSPNEMLDNFLRPVDVVLMHRLNDKSTAVLLTGREASEIKRTCYHKLHHNLLIHVNDINGPTQLPVRSSVSSQEQKLLTIAKLFSGESHYTSLKEVHRIAKRVGRLYPLYFTCLGIRSDVSEKLYGILVEKQYLDFAGVMTEELLKILRGVKSKDPLTLDLTGEYQMYNQTLLVKLLGIFKKLIVQTSIPLKNSHNALCQWVGTRGRLKEYPGSALESVLNPEFEPTCSQ